MPERPLWSRSSRLGIYMLYPIPQELLIHRWVTPLFLSLCLAAHLHPKFDPNLHVDSQRPYRGESHKSNVWKLPALIASLRGPVLLSLPFNVILSGMMVSLALVSSLSADYLPSHGTSHLLVGDLRVFEGIHDWLESLMQSLGRKYSHTKAIKDEVWPNSTSPSSLDTCDRANDGLEVVRSSYIYLHTSCGNGPQGEERALRILSGGPSEG